MGIDGAPTRTSPGSSEDARARCLEREPTPGLFSRRVLVIDDDSPSREILACILRTAGYLVAEAPTGLEGLQFLQEAPVDLLITDLQMPGMSGWKIAQAARRLWPGLPIVLVTGNPEALDARPDLRDLVSAILVKPFGAGPLRDSVQGAIATRGGDPPAPKVGGARPGSVNAPAGAKRWLPPWP